MRPQADRRTVTRMVAVPLLPRRSLAAVALLAAALLAGPPGGRAGAALTAQRVRVGDHPAFVRAVVDFGGGRLTAHAVAATDPAPFDGSAAVRVAHARVRTPALRGAGFGIAVRVLERAHRAQIAVAGLPGRFKYVSYAVVGGTRLAVDLWKSAPPSPAATIRVGAGGCLTLSRVAVQRGSVRAAGRERALFEHQFAVVLRGRDGRVLGRRHVSATGRWSARVGYRTRLGQHGTVEAVALSPKDGALACIVQARVTLPAFP